MKISRPFSRPGRRKAAAFSLVEIALALGIVGFALVGIVGAIPVAMNNERLSVAQTRAASLANTIFANFRAGSFSAAQYIDPPYGSTTPPATVNLNTASTTLVLTFYAVFDEVTTLASTSDERRLHFLSGVPSSTTSSYGASTYYKIVLHFDNNPAGTLTPYQESATVTTHAQANAVEVSITDISRPNDVFRFSSVIANRSE